MLFGAGTAAVLAFASRLDPALRRILLSGVLAIGSVVAATGWLGVALHQQPWGSPSQHLWRGAATLTYANATAALLVPLVLVPLARGTAIADGFVFACTPNFSVRGSEQDHRTIDLR